MKTLLLLLISTATILATDVTLGWSPNTEPDIAGYRVFSGPASRSYSVTNDAGKTLSYTITNLPPGLWFFAATAYNSNRLESLFSNEAVFSNPPSAPATRRRQSHTNTTWIGWTNLPEIVCIETSHDLLTWQSWLGLEFTADPRPSALSLLVLPSGDAAFWRTIRP